MTAEFLWINTPLMALFFALWVGVPMWMIFKRPARDTRTVSAYLRKRATTGMPAQRRELVLAGRS